MGSYTKVLGYRDASGRAFIKCPGCGEKQEIVFGSDGYEADKDGRLWPEFVCMAQHGWRYTCFYQHGVRIVNL